MCMVKVEMSKNRWQIVETRDKTKLKARILAAGRGITVGKLIETLIDEAWLEDETKPTPKSSGKIKKILKRYQHSASTLLENGG